MPPGARKESGTTSEATWWTPYLTGPDIVISRHRGISMLVLSENGEDGAGSAGARQAQEDSDSQARTGRRRNCPDESLPRSFHFVGKGGFSITQTSAPPGWARENAMRCPSGLAL